ncbi:MAG: hypothetical protein QOF74_7179, partial [Caballeronia mineralivorans]|nr:hypothetical protein [Caballeronia mineralivorans]
MHEATRVERTGVPGYLRKRLPQLSLGTDLSPDSSEVIERLEFWIGRGPKQRVTRCSAVAIRRRMAGHVGVVSQRAAAIRTSAHPDRMGHRYFKPVAGSDFPSSCVRILLSPGEKVGHWMPMPLTIGGITSIPETPAPSLGALTPAQPGHRRGHRRPPCRLSGGISTTQQGDKTTPEGGIAATRSGDIRYPTGITCCKQSLRPACSMRARIASQCKDIDHPP